MRIIIFVVLTMTYASQVFSQSGRKQVDTLKIATGQHFVKGDTLIIGPGSRADKGYAHLQVAPRKGVPATFLTPGWEGYRLQVAGFKEVAGQRTYLVLSFTLNNKTLKYWCDPELALKAGEIIY